MIAIRNLTKKYRDINIYKDFSIDFEENRITGIVGPSGCGKTTLLRILAGLETFEGGTISGIGPGGISFVFQEDRLLPWMNVRQNIELVLKSKMTPEEAGKRVLEVLELLDMVHARDLMPSELSGGMQRRVAIGRALAYDGDLLLLDEPFKGLDDKLKNEILEELTAIWGKRHKTIIIVTHDLEDAYRLADTVYEFSGRPVSWCRIHGMGCDGPAPSEEPGPVDLQGEIQL